MEEEPVLGEMIGNTEAKPILPRSLCQFARHIPFRTHSDRVPASEWAIIHSKTVMKLNNWDNIFCSRFLKQLNPSVRVPLLPFEEGDEILIAKLCVGTISLKVVGVFRSVLDIYEVRIPFVSKGRN